MARESGALHLQRTRPDPDPDRLEMRVRTLHLSRLVGIATAVAASVASCTVLDLDSGRQRDRLAEARALWAAQAIYSYDYVLQRSCYCGGGTEPARVQVRDGVRTAVVFVEDGTPAPAYVEHLYLTVPELFDFVDDAITRGAHSIEVRYHTTLGYPTFVQVDYDENAIDEEMAFSASGFVPRG